MRVRFGPAGTPTNYQGDKAGIPQHLRDMGLDAFEYQATYGVKISAEDAQRMGEAARGTDILLSFHGPYYINLNGKPETVDKSIVRLVRSAWAAEKMGAYRIVFHVGFYGDFSPEGSIGRVVEALRRAIEETRKRGIKTFTFSPETIGKQKQIGGVDEVIEICGSLDHTLPTFDWSHVHARDGGSLKAKGDILKIVDETEKRLGKEAIDPLHCHYTPIEYGEKGEKRHLTMDEGFEPDFKVVGEALLEVGVDATVISESPILEQDSVKMREILSDLSSKTA